MSSSFSRAAASRGVRRVLHSFSGYSISNYYVFILPLANRDFAKTRSVIVCRFRFILKVAFLFYERDYLYDDIVQVLTIRVIILSRFIVVVLIAISFMSTVVILFIRLTPCPC